MKTYLDPRRVENELVKQQRDIRYIRAAHKAIAMMNVKGQWGYDSGWADELLVEVWRWDNHISGYTLRLVDTRKATRHTEYEDVCIAFYDTGEIEIVNHG